MTNEDSHYTKEDSKQVRELCLASLRKAKDTRRTLITWTEWTQFKKQGRDMSGYRAMRRTRLQRRAEELRKETGKSMRTCLYWAREELSRPKPYLNEGAELGGI